MRFMVNRTSFKKFIAQFILFALAYGFLMVNYIDATGPNPASFLAKFYHFWLIAIYFMPFIFVIICRFEDWELFISLGLTASLCNDSLWGFWHLMMGSFTMPQFWSWAYNWFIPNGNFLFDLSLGIYIPVYAFMMSASIYGRIVAVALLLRKWWVEEKIIV